MLLFSGYWWYCYLRWPKINCHHWYWIRIPVEHCPLPSETSSSKVKRSKQNINTFFQFMNYNMLYMRSLIHHNFNQLNGKWNVRPFYCKSRIRKRTKHNKMSHLEGCTMVPEIAVTWFEPNMLFGSGKVQKTIVGCTVVNYFV